MIFAVLLAAGTSSRFERSCPSGWPKARKDKLQALFDGRPVWRAGYDALTGHRRISGVGIVCRSGAEDRFTGSGAAFVVPGGKTRLESARIGAAATPESASIILVHDAARPGLSPQLIDRVLSAAEKHGAAVPALPVKDTLKRGPDWVRETVDRRELYQAQTPQAARRDWLLSALSEAREATDEAMALERAGYKVKLVEGEESNIKITSLDDLLRQASLHSGMASSTGFGYDVHAFSQDKERPLMLGGVLFPGEPGLAGHSDADVVLHAITDALLGAIGRGDIGEHFPNTDKRWSSADSVIFLQEAARQIASMSGVVTSVDATILAERPKIGEHRQEMRSKIAQELGISSRRVNVKATTSEGLGAIGRGEGIAAMAVVTVYLPAGRIEV